MCLFIDGGLVIAIILIIVLFNLICLFAMILLIDCCLLFCYLVVVYTALLDSCYFLLGCYSFAFVLIVGRLRFVVLVH